MKNLIKIALCLCAVLMLASCSRQSAPASGASAPSRITSVPAESPVTLRIMQAYNVVTQPYGEVELWRRYERRTNVTIDWISVTDAEATERRNLSIASGDLPDAYYRLSFSNADLLNYGMDGTFINLAPLIDEHAPHFRVMMGLDSSIPRGITQADGNIYSLPFLCDFLSANYGTKIFYNMKWLDAVNRNEPTTLDEFVETMRLFKAANPGGGARVIPLEGGDIGGIVTYFHGLFGLQNRGSAHNRVDIDPVTNRLRFFMASDEYRAQMEFLHMLYREELLNPDIFTNNLNIVGANMQNQFVGSYVSVNPMAAGQFAVDYMGGGVMTGPTGIRLANGVNPLMRASGAFTITRVNRYPELTLNWVDYFYSEDGIREFFMGWEGETYTIDENGVYNYVEYITNNPQGLMLDQAVSQFVPWPGAGQPTLQTEKFSKGGASMPQALEATVKAAPYFPREIWAAFTYTFEENDLLISLQTDLTTCINEARADFVTNGVTDASWNRYLSDLRSIGMDRFMQIMEAAHTRYIQ